MAFQTTEFIIHPHNPRLSRTGYSHRQRNYEFALITCPDLQPTNSSYAVVSIVRVTPCPAGGLAWLRNLSRGSTVFPMGRGPLMLQVRVLGASALYRSISRVL
jgi:hypothetical protein